MTLRKASGHLCHVGHLVAFLNQDAQQSRTKRFDKAEGEVLQNGMRADRGIEPLKGVNMFRDFTCRCPDLLRSSVVSVMHFRSPFISRYSIFPPSSGLTRCRRERMRSLSGGVDRVHEDFFEHRSNRIGVADSGSFQRTLMTVRGRSGMDGFSSECRPLYWLPEPPRKAVAGCPRKKYKRVKFPRWDQYLMVRASAEFPHIVRGGAGGMSLRCRRHGR